MATSATISTSSSLSATTEPGKKEMKDTRRRVKVYVLNEKRTWEDRGTGHVTCAYNDRLQGLALTVKSESDCTIALESKILSDTAYQKQQETLIIWSEGDNYELALSFQEKAGCEEIWERICQVQGRDPSVDVTQETSIGYEGDADNDADADVATSGGQTGAGRSDDDQVACVDVSTSTGEAGQAGANSLVLRLPPCELSLLQEISDLISSSFASPMVREALVNALESQGYIKKLLDLFRMCEDLDNRDSLHILHRIMMNIFMLNKNALFEILFADEHLKDVIGVLEFDPAQAQLGQEPRHHREYLWEQAAFREVIPIANEELRAKIHQTYRVQYIQDFILPAPSIFEENLLSTLSSFIFFNKVEIVSMIKEDETFLKKLFGKLTSKTITVENKRDVSAFLKEFCSFSQKLQPQQRDDFFRCLTSHGVLKALENCFHTDDDQTRLNAIEILSYVVDYNASLVREYALQQSRGTGGATSDDPIPTSGKKLNLLNIIIDQMFYDDRNDPEIAASLQLAGILKILIDPENMLSTSSMCFPNKLPKSDKSEFLPFFYRNCIGNLVGPLMEAVTPEEKLKNDDYRTAQVLNIILDVLTFCIEHHSYHIRTYVVNKNLLRSVLILLQSRHKFLALSALRLFRRVVQAKDSTYNTYIIREHLLEHVARCFKANGPRYNLLNSALLELIEFIRTEDLHVLAADLCENYFDTYFSDVKYVKTFTALKLRYEQFMERQRLLAGASSSSTSSKPPLNAASSIGVFGRRLSATPSPAVVDANAEEEWFNEVDNDEWDDELSGNVELSATATGGDADAENDSRVTPPFNNENEFPGSVVARKPAGTKSDKDDDEDFALSPLLKPLISPRTSPPLTPVPAAPSSNQQQQTMIGSPRPQIVIKTITAASLNIQATGAEQTITGAGLAVAPVAAGPTPSMANISAATGPRKSLVDYDDDSSSSDEEEELPATADQLASTRVKADSTESESGEQPPAKKHKDDQSEQS